MKWSVRRTSEKSLIEAESTSLDGSGVDKHTFTAASERSRSKRVLIIADNQSSTKIIGDAFAANAYEVLATSYIPEAIRFATTHNPGCILLVLSSLPAISDAARLFRQHTPVRIIGFSPIPVTAAQRKVALESGCDDYREAFMRTDCQGEHSRFSRADQPTKDQNELFFPC